MRELFGKDYEHLSYADYHDKKTDTHYAITLGGEVLQKLVVADFSFRYDRFPTQTDKEFYINRQVALFNEQLPVIT